MREIILVKGHFNPCLLSDRFGTLFQLVFGALHTFLLELVDEYHIKAIIDVALLNMLRNNLGNSKPDGMKCQDDLSYENGVVIFFLSCTVQGN